MYRFQMQSTFFSRFLALCGVVVVVVGAALPFHIVEAIEEPRRPAQELTPPPPNDPPPPQEIPAPVPTPAPAEASGNSAKAFIIPELNVEIPGVELQDPTKDGKTVAVSFFGSYFNGLYRFLLGAGIATAIIMLMIGGLQYALGHHLQEKGLDRIKAAATGLVLLMTAFLVLYSVNPQLTLFKPLNLAFVERNPDTLGGDHDHVDENSAVSTSTVGSIREYIARQKSCQAKLPPEKQSEPASLTYTNNQFFGALDCLHSGGPRKQPVTVIGLHEGKINGGVPHWMFEQMKKGENGGGTSTHYFISRSGDIQQVLGENLVAHHGIYNRSSIGIDLETCPTSAGLSAEKILESCKPSSAMYDALDKLIKEIKSRHPIQRILGHCEVSNRGGARVDPRMFDWTRIGESPSRHQNGNCIWSANWVNDDQLILGPRQ